MIKRKSIREKGKVRTSDLFREVKIGDKVALVRNLSFTMDFPKRFHGKTGVIREKRGLSYIVDFYDGKMPKSVVVKRINLKKLPN